MEEMHCSGDTVLTPGRALSPTIAAVEGVGVTGSGLGSAGAADIDGGGGSAFALEFADEGRPRAELSRLRFGASLTLGWM